MTLKFWLRAAVVVLAAVLVAVPAVAQTSSTTGAIEGRVTDVNGQPIEGVKVSATAGRAPITVSSNAQGTFLIANLPPGDYELKLEKQGFSTIVQKGVTVNIASRRVVPFVLTVGQVESVTVTAEAPMVDPKSTTIGGTFTIDKYVNYIPVGRNFSQTFALAPGVESGGGTGAGNYSISGSSGLENSYLVDGVNITNGGYGGLGTYSGVYGSLGSGVTYDFLEEIQVKTGAIDAEYGQATGGVINTVVKSGTNTLSGRAGVNILPKSLVSGFKPVDYTVAAVNQESRSNTDIGLSVGGPIVKDKLFYFVAFNPVKTKEGFRIEDQLIPASQALGNTHFVTAGKTFERERTSNNWAAKLNWYMSPNHRLELTGFGDPSRGPNGPQRTTAQASALSFLDYNQGGGQSRISYGANSFSLKYDGVITPTFFVQAQVSRKNGKFDETLALNKPTLTDQRELRCILGLGGCGVDSPGTGTVWRWGGAGFLAPQEDKSWQYKAVATWALPKNELKGGIDYYDLEFNEAQQYPGDPTDFPIPLDVNQDGDYDTQGAGLVPCATAPAGDDCFIDLTSSSGYLVTGRSNTNFRVTRARFNPLPPPTTAKEMNIFIQDTLTLGTRWNLKLGLRGTQQKMAGSGTYTLPFTRVQNPLDPGNPGDLIRVPGTSTYPAQTYKFDWAYAPRLGVTFDVTGKGTSKLYANASRYFERIPSDLAIRALSNEVGLSLYRFNNYDIANYTALDPLGGNPNTTTFFQGIDPEVILPKTKLPYVDELVLGYQQELGRDMSLEVRAVYREQGRALEDIQYNSVESIQNFYYGTGYGYPSDPFPAFPVSVFSAYVLANPGDNSPAGFPKPDRKYKALEVVFNKRFANHWLLYANYRFSKLRGFYEGLYRNDNGQDDPNISSLYDFPNSPLLSTQFDKGALNTDRPHSIKMYGSYAWDNGVTAGASINWASGTPRTSLLAHPNYQNAGEIPGLNPIYAWWTFSDTATIQALGGDTVTCDVPSGLCLAKGPIEVNGADGGADSGTFLYDFTHVKRGNLGRTPKILNVDLSVGYTRKVKMGSMQFGVAIFNALNQQKGTFFDDQVERQATIPDPDFGKVFTYNDPRTVRFNVAWSF